MNLGIISKEEKLIDIKSKVDLKNLKSDYFLIKIFDNIQNHKSLLIMKYNKRLQNRLNININDYKKYSQLFSSIEIELKLVDNKYNEFINIIDKEKEYYHIYFDNSTEEIKDNHLKYSHKINKIKILIDYQVKSFNQLFYNCKYISSIFFKKFFRINITDMSYMFSGCESLNELNLSNFITDNVTDMSYMFSKCSSLKELNLSNFNTNNVTNMSGMFRECSLLKELNLSNFNTNNVTDMSGMFLECNSLKNLNLSSFNTSNVIYMSGMFGGCSSLNELNISNFNTNSVLYMTGMFSNCTSLNELNLSNFNTNNVVDMSYIFDGCTDEFKNKIKEKYKSLMT